MAERGGGERLWREAVERGGGEGWWREVVDLSSGSGWRTEAGWSLEERREGTLGRGARHAPPLAASAVQLLTMLPPALPLPLLEGAVGARPRAAGAPDRGAEGSVWRKAILSIALSGLWDRDFDKYDTHACVSEQHGHA